ncbi:efflux RND transporter periplasmic adaptor subunit [Aurantivibrio plasticivorans]
MDISFDAPHAQKTSTHFARHKVRPPIPYLIRLVIFLCLAASAHFAAAEAAPVAIHSAIKANLIEDIPLTGTVVAPTHSTLSASVAGLVTKRHAAIGDEVKTGQVLLELDDEIVKIELDGAQASLQSALANHAEAQRRVQEAAPLVKQNSIAATEMRARESQAKIAQAAVDRARAEVARRSAELKRHTIAAPFDGVISQRYAEVGEWVSPGREMYELVATHDVYLDFQVPQSIYPRVSGNANIFVNFDAIPNQQFAASIVSRVPVNNASARTFLIRARLVEQPPSITPGMSTHGTLQLQSSEQGVMVPRDAVIRYSDGRIVVWVVDLSEDEPTVSERIVTLGISSNGQVEIKRGLKPGEVVVTEGNEALRPAQKVKITNRGSLGSAQAL